MKAIFLANNKGNIDYVYPREAQERIRALVDIDLDNVYCQEDLVESPEKFKDVEYIFSTWSMPGGGEDKDDFARFFPNAKALFYAAGSVKYFAKHYLDKNIKIFSAFAANAVPVAEFTLAQILLANKGYFGALRSFKGEGDYKTSGDYSRARKGNYSTNVGIVGAGMIGKMVIELLKPFKVNILVYDAFLSEEKIKELGGKKVTLEELFKESDVVSNHLANVPATVGIFKGEHFMMMKENATFINTGRGAQVDEQGLIDALKARRDISAVLDVTIQEPPCADSDFYKLDNVFLTPHIAGSQGNEVRRMSEIVIDQFEALLKGNPTKYEITEEMLKTMA